MIFRLPSSRGASLFAFAAFALVGVTSLCAHGTLLEPMSRVYRVYRDNPEAPSAPWARAALAVSDKNAFYTWNQVSRNIPDFNHRAVVPDGQLASAGLAAYAGLDLVRSDWPATPVAAGNYALQFWATAAHEPSYFDVYLTKADYDPAQPLTWDRLELLGAKVPYTKDDPNHWRIAVTLPPRMGKHVLYLVWQRIDPVGEVFFTASDVVFDGAVTSNPTTPTVPTTPTNPQPETPTTPVTPTPSNPTTPTTPTVPVTPTNPAPGTSVPPTAQPIQVGDVRLDFVSDDAWTGGYRATIRLTNLGTTPLTNWQVGFQGAFAITSLWDTRYLCDGSGGHSVAHPAWASTLAPGASTTFGFVVSGPPVAPTNFTVNGQGASGASTPVASAAVLRAELRLDATWNTGFTATVRVTNAGTRPVDGWIAAFEAPFAISSAWNADYARVTGVHTFTAASWNRRLAPGQSVEIGFSASGAPAPVADVVARPR